MTSSWGGPTALSSVPYEPFTVTFPAVAVSTANEEFIPDALKSNGGCSFSLKELRERIFPFLNFLGAVAKEQSSQIQTLTGTSQQAIGSVSSALVTSIQTQAATNQITTFFNNENSNQLQTWKSAIQQNYSTIEQTLNTASGEINTNIATLSIPQTSLQYTDVLQSVGGDWRKKSFLAKV